MCNTSSPLSRSSKLAKPRVLAVESCGTTRNTDPTLDTALKAIAADYFGVYEVQSKCPKDSTQYAVIKS